MIELGDIVFSGGDVSTDFDLRWPTGDTSHANSLPSDPFQALEDAGNFIVRSIDEIRSDINSDSQGAQFLTTVEAIGGGIQFPIWEQPTSALGLLFGKDVDLIKYVMPTLKVEFSYRQSFGPVWAVPPVMVNIGGRLGAEVNLAFGYDTRGIRRFIADGYDLADLGDLAYGFYIDDRVVDGQDQPEARLYGELGAGASVTAYVAEIGAEGGIFAQILLDINDPNDDGKFYLDEFGDLCSPLCLFDFSGQLGAYLKVFWKIDLWLFSIGDEYTLVRITLLNFDIPCCPVPPNLAVLDKDTGILTLNVGDRGDQRNAGRGEIDEDYVITAVGPGKVKVEAFGKKQYFGSDEDGWVTTIVGDAGDGNDSIVVEGNPVDQNGEYIPVEFYGGSGNDKLVGGAGNDKLFGNAGSDEIDGGAGDDLIYAHDSSSQGSGSPYEILTGGLGNDRIYGGGGSDSIHAGEGDDYVYGCLLYTSPSPRD